MSTELGVWMAMAMLVQQPGGPLVTWGGMASHLAFVIAANLMGGSVLVGLTCHVIYGRRDLPTEAAPARPAPGTPARPPCAPP